MILWTLGHWGVGVSWIIVSVYYYGNIGYVASTITYLIFLFLILLFAVAPLVLFKREQKQDLSLNSLLFISSAFIIIELTRDFFFGGFPWLIPGTVLLDTKLSQIIPLIGAGGASFIIYFISSLIARYWQTSKLRALLIFIFASFLLIEQSSQPIKDYDDSITVRLVQSSLDPKIKQLNKNRSLIEETLIKLSKENSELVDLIIWPEAELPYAYQSKEYIALKQKFEQKPKLITGIWHFDDNSLFNALVNVNNDEIYQKRHLVPFGEYIPFKKALNPILSYFGAPISDISPGEDNQELISLNSKYKIAPLICYDIVFGNDVRKTVKSSNFIINISNDAWFGRSLGPYQHLEISRIRALENNKWLVRATNDGFSAVIDNKGTIVDLLDKGIQGFLDSNISTTNSPTIYALYGYYVPYLFAIFYTIFSLGRFLWLKHRVF